MRELSSLNTKTRTTVDATSLTAVDPLPSWNQGAAKDAIINFVRVTTDATSPHFISEHDRIVAFDQDGTTLVEHPYHTQVAFALHRLAELAPLHPDWQHTEPFKSALARDLAAIANFVLADFDALVAATHSGLSTNEFAKIVAEWLTKAVHPRWQQPYTQLVYQPMLEVMTYLRANSFRIYIVVGGGQSFTRVYAEQVYGIPPEQIIGSPWSVKYDSVGKVMLESLAHLMLYNDGAAKAEDLHTGLGRQPSVAFGNSTGDRQMLDYVQAADGARLLGLVLHDDPQREYAYAPGLMSMQAFCAEARSKGWLTISMKDDWKRVFLFD